MPGNESDAAALFDAFSGEQNRRRWSLVTDDEKRTLLSATASKGSRSIVAQAATASGGRPDRSFLDAWADQWTALREALQR
jgi:hypothetical protein